MIGYHLLHHRMSSAFNIDHTFGIDLRTHIIIFFCHIRKSSIYIQLCHRLGGLLDPKYLGRNVIPHLTEQFILQCGQLLLCSKDRLFQFFQLRSNIAFCIGQSLLADIILRHQILVGIRHFQIITEDLVELDLHVFDSGPLTLFGLYLGQPGFSFCLGSPVSIHILIVAIPDHISFPDGDRRFLLNGLLHQII